MENNVHEYWYFYMKKWIFANFDFIPLHQCYKYTYRNFIDY